MIDYHEIVTCMRSYSPAGYGETRNFIDGNVSKLSPYIARGVISTRQFAEELISKGYLIEKFEKFYQELAWRDYWQQIWKNRGSAIDKNIVGSGYHIQTGLIKSIVEGKTGIRGIDDGVNTLYSCGYIHNHVRMYIASIHCQMALSDWYSGAKWMYYYLLDADWASNALSWQWVAGTFNDRRYYVNQENINRHCYTNDKHTFLDHSYEELQSKRDIPQLLKGKTYRDLETFLPKTELPALNLNIKTALYNMYNLDPNWRKEELLNRVLILETSIFDKYPVSDRTINFVKALSQNIDGIQIYTGEFDSLKQHFPDMEFVYKEHPLNMNYSGIEDEREWLAPDIEASGSFFNYWKKVKKRLIEKYEKTDQFSLA